MAKTEKAKAVFNYVKEHDGEQFTAADIAAALGVSTASVNGTVTSSFQRHKDENKVETPLMERIPAVITLEDGTPKAVNFIRLTEAGKAFDIDAE